MNSLFLFAQVAQDAEPAAAASGMAWWNTAAPWLLSFWTGGLLAALGVWLVMILRRQRDRAAGAIIAVAGLLILAAGLPFMGEWGLQIVFWLLAGMTAISAVCTVASRSPVYSAIWFAMTLLGTAGVFLVQGAQFLGVATIVVYAGAILVTFLFVLMLAQPEGQAFYDRVSWGRVPVGIASLTGGLIVAGVAHLSRAAVLVPSQAEDRLQTVLHGEHVAKLGGTLFTKHLISVEVAGTLLLTALVGAIAIAIHNKQTAERPGDPSHE